MAVGNNVKPISLKRLKKLFIITTLTAFSCSVFSQEVVRDTLVAKSYDGIVVSEQTLENRRELTEKARKKMDERNRQVWQQVRCDVSHLTVKGTITPEDFCFMDSLPNLTHLDLSHVRFAPFAIIEEEDSRLIFRYSWYDGKNELNFSLPKNLQRVLLPKTLYFVGHGVFRESQIDSIVIPRGVRRIGINAFSDCVNLRYISLPNGLKMIEGQAFSGSGLTRIEIPKSVKKIGQGLFDDTLNLREISVHWQDPASVEILDRPWSEFPNEFGVSWGMILSNIPMGEVKLIVPRGTREKYLALEPWMYFQIVEREE